MAHVLAKVKLLNDVPSPKVNGVKTGYIPHHKFNNNEYLTSGLHNYGDQNLHFPGETLLTEITFLDWEHIKNKIKKGDEFYISEVNRIIGIGEVSEIIV